MVKEGEIELRINCMEVRYEELKEVTFGGGMEHFHCVA
jgi:hypothetical protein